MAKEGKFIRIALVTLPVGLLVLGVASMLYTHFKPDNPELEEDYNKRMDAASLNRRPVNRVDLERYVRILSEEIGERNLGKPEGLERAAIWIQSTLKGGNLGYQVEQQTVLAEGKELRNLIAELPGTRQRKEIIIVGAHYDSVAGCPGANSGGTGVAAALSLAQAFAGDPQARTIRFVFFVNEEAPYFGTDNMGSRAYARRCSSREEKVVAMLSLDSLGYFTDEAGSQTYPEGKYSDLPQLGNFIAFSGDKMAKFRADSARNLMTRTTGLPAVSTTFSELSSDEISFAKYNFPSVLVTDTASFRYPMFHQPGDTKDQIDFERFEKVCAGLKAVLDSWANP